MYNSLRLGVLIVVMFLGQLLFGQSIDKKEMQITRIDQSIKVNGDLDEGAWLSAPVYSDFTQNSPEPNIPAPQKTEVKILYDNVNIYVGAVMYDVSRDSILRQLCIRDEKGQRSRNVFSSTNTDWFGIALDTYKDGINGVIFAVSPMNVQFDMKYSDQGRDKNWDSVWRSEVKIHEDKWVVEMAIPFSALRIPTSEIQEWHVNFCRQIRRQRSENWWNKIDPGVEGFFNQFGLLKGLENIESPVRFQATPYVASVLSYQREPDATPERTNGRTFTGGMDLKYGINDAFTLDMTLIPNFGEVQSDDQILNLSQFEVRFDENRPFFTEGTELFNKGNIFYSRRIGGSPLNRSVADDNLGINESVTSNPVETPLINAFKLSGRTNSGLGIGVFNGIVGKTFATVENTVTGETREVETNPFTNYNILVFDQNLKNNSFVTLINANTLRFGDDYDANVTGVVFNARNKKQTLSVSGEGKLSQLYNKQADGSLNTDLGHAYSLNIGKTGGQYTYGAFYNEESDTYNPNDLGFLFNNNERSMGVYAGFNQFEPFGKFNGGGANIELGMSMLYDPGVYNNMDLSLGGYLITKDFFSFGGNISSSVTDRFDYFEPRTSDLSVYVRKPGYFYTGGWISSDYRKRFAVDVRAGMGNGYFNKERYITWTFSPRFRVNDRLFFLWSTRNEHNINETGYASTDVNDNPVLALRDVARVTNTLSTNYIFNENMGMTLRVRHFWSKVNHDSYHYVGNKGELLIGPTDVDADNKFSALTLDWVYTWRFAPGSDLVLVYKNQVFGGGSDNTGINYFKDWNERENDLISNTITLKIQYFLDYYVLKNQIKNRRQKL